MSRSRKKFQKLQVHGYIAVTRAGALVASMITKHPEGECPAVYLRASSASRYGIARRVLVTFELSEPEVCEGEGGGTQNDRG